VAQSSANNGAKDDSSLKKPIPPPMQSVIKGGWTYRIENPAETAISALKELAEAIRALAQEIRSHSRAFVRHGPRMLSPSETAHREQQIAALADEIEKLADRVPQSNVTYEDVNAILAQLREVGFLPDNLLVSNVARAIYALQQRRAETDLGARPD
jgi:hypothetical protein